MLITLQQLKSALQAVKSYITSVVPTKTSDLTNDSGFITNATVPTATTSKSGTTTTLTVTDKNGTTTAQILDGAQGAKGDTGDSGVYIGTSAPTGDETVWIDTSGDPDTDSQSIEDLRNSLSNVKDVSRHIALNNTYSGTITSFVDVDVPAGEYIIDVDNIESTDTDTSICDVVFNYESGSTHTRLKRGSNIRRKITFDNNVVSIRFYASDGYASSVGDDFTFTGFKLCKNYQLIEDLTTLKTIVDEAKQVIFDETTANKRTDLIPNIPSTLSTFGNIANTNYFMSDRVIPKNSFIKSVKIGTKISNDGTIIFINDNNEVVYKYDAPCTADVWNVFDINQFVNENLRIAVSARPLWGVASVLDDTTFCTDGALWESNQTDVEVGDTITFTTSTAYIFLMAIQWEIETGDKISDGVITVKDKRPESGYHNFSVSVNYSDFTDNVADGESLYTDYGVIALPTNYSATGTPTKLIIACGGSGDRIGANTNPYSLQGWSYFLAKGFAVMDMNGISAAWTSAKGVPISGLHYCHKNLLLSYAKGYEYVMKKFNLEPHVFVSGVSMGGGAAALITQSNIIPVIANAFFCPALSVYKQDYMSAWGGENQKKSIAGQWDFPDWSTTTPSQEYFLANIDKIRGFDNLLIRTVGDHDAANANYGNEAEATAYNSMQKIYPVPIKIWHCENDALVPYRYSNFMVNMIKNGGGQAWLRSFAEGGHVGGWSTGSVSDTDIDGNTVTTSIPFYEAVLFFKRFG